MTMDLTTNINNVGQVLQIILQKKVLENFEPDLYFYQYGEKPVWTDGYNTLAWTRVNRLLVDYTSAILQEGTTPVEQTTNNNTISVNATQYGLYVTISDKLLAVAPFDIVGRNALEVSHNLSRIIDEAIQHTLWTTCPVANIAYVNSNSMTFTGNRSSIGSGDVMEAGMVAEAHAILNGKAAPMFDGYYMAFMHTNVVYDLRVETNTGSFIDVNKYKRPEEILKWEIWAIGWVRIISSPFIKRVKSSVTVYPNYFLWVGAYWVGVLQAPQTYITPNTPTDSNPLAQRVKVGAKVAFGTTILQPDALLIVESTSNLEVGSSFNPLP